MNTKKFIHLDGEGRVCGIVSAEQLWANVYGLKYNRPEIILDQKVWKSLFEQAKTAAYQMGAETIQVRLRKEYEPQTFRNILSEIGLEKISERHEYQCDVSRLPEDVGSPLIWRTMNMLAWNNEELTCGPECIAIGALNGQNCALVVAQINKESGRSSLSYLGIIPELRGKGLGKWVHRYGFRMIKSQGGKLYHGGTDSKNIPMRKLFEFHGCKLFCEMEEWGCDLKGGLNEKTRS